MKLFDKLKNVFFEEEYVEVEDKEPKKKKEVIAKKIDTRKIDIKEEKEKEEIVPKKEETSDNKFKFPEILDDDFIDESIKEEKKPIVTSYYEKKETINYNGIYDKKDNNNYSGLYEKREEKKMFRASPIISPIYGVLDKNYTKEEMIPKKEIHISGARTHTKVDLDDVRQKAFGSADKTNEIVEDINEKTILYDMNVDETPVVEKVTMGDAAEYFSELGLEYNVDYKDKNKSVGRRSDKEELKEVENNYDENTLEHSLFDIIDSMYEEKE